PFTTPVCRLSLHDALPIFGAAQNVPKGIVRSVWVSGLLGWIMICAILLAIPDVREGVNKGSDVVHWTMKAVLPAWVAWTLLSGIDRKSTRLNSSHQIISYA